jgi:hypothetical protein
MLSLDNLDRTESNDRFRETLPFAWVRYLGRHREVRASVPFLQG